jgi:membrane protein YdbS with pleckstrin-like domain
MRIGKNWWSIAAITVLAIGAICSAYLPVQRAQGRSFTTDTRPVETYIQNGKGLGTRLRIPAAYMQWEEDRRGGLTNVVGLIAIYPDMTPYALLSAEEHMKYPGGSERMIRSNLTR